MWLVLVMVALATNMVNVVGYYKCRKDAGRKLKTSLAMDPRLADFWVRIEHHESLHAHDAVGVFTKGVDGGYPARP